MSGTGQAVYVVDDDDAVRDGLALLIRSVGLEVETYASAAAFLADLSPDRGGCLILDVRMPGMSGMELQEELNRMEVSLPIIFITGHGDVPMAVRAMKEGAVDFIPKPFSDQELLDRVHTALHQDAEQREQIAERHEIERRVNSLTPREREVMSMVVAGNANKVIAGSLGVSQRTVEIHRARVMEKMEAGSLAELVGLALALERP